MLNFHRPYKIDEKKKSFSWVINSPLLHFYLNPPPKQMQKEAFRAIRRSSKHHDMLWTPEAPTASSVSTESMMVFMYIQALKRSHSQVKRSFLVYKNHLIVSLG